METTFEFKLQARGTGGSAQEVVPAYTLWETSGSLPPFRFLLKILYLSFHKSCCLLQGVAQKTEDWNLGVNLCTRICPSPEPHASPPHSPKSGCRFQSCVLGRWRVIVESGSQGNQFP